MTETNEMPDALAAFDTLMACLQTGLGSDHVPKLCETIRAALVQAQETVKGDMTLPELPDGWFYDKLENSSMGRWDVRIGRAGSGANGGRYIFHDAHVYAKGPRLAIDEILAKINAPKPGQEG